MKNHELIQLSPEELEGQLQEACKDYSQQQEDIAAGKESNYSKLREMRRTIARIQTTLQNKRNSA